ncbi:MAG: PAS domain-containing protein [Kiritimatiellae bacterium]|nr:PAS domain-containing protein [Kiritimatiellia bacterium]
MNKAQRRRRRRVWQVTLAAGLLVEVGFVVFATVSIFRGGEWAVPVWQLIAFAAILVWIYVAYLKQRSIDISGFVVDEKIKTHSLVQQLREGIILLDPENHVLLINTKAAQLTGLSEIGALGKDFAGEVEEDVAQMLRANLAGEIEGKLEHTGLAARFHITLLETRGGEDSPKLLYVRTAENATAAAPPADTGPGWQAPAAETLKLLARRLADSARAQPDGAQREESARIALRGLALGSALEDLETAAKVECRLLAADLAKVRVPLQDVVGEIVEEHSEFASALNVQIDAGGARQAYAVAGDAALLGKTVRDVFCHALLHTPAGGVVRIRTAEMGENIGLSVNDGGPAVDRGDVAQLFEKAYAGVKDENGNVTREMGVGLYLARGIVEAHGGSLWAESPEEGGLRVVLMVPRA